MKNEKQILKEIQLLKNRITELMKEVQNSSKDFPDEHTIGRLSNAIEDIRVNHYKLEILKAVLI